MAHNTGINSDSNTHFIIHVHHYFFTFYESKTNYVGLSSDHLHNEIRFVIISALCELELQS